MLRYLFSLLLICFSSTIFGQIVINEAFDFEKISLHEEALIFETTENISIEEVQNIPFNQFLKIENPNTNTGFTESNF